VPRLFGLEIRSAEDAPRAFYLACEHGERPKTPERSELLRGCCKHGLEADGAVRTIAFPSQRPR
jgi:hypothetical protein